MRSFSVFAVIFAGVLYSESTLAQTQVESPAPIWWGKPSDHPNVPVMRWYGWQTLIGLVAADAVTISSVLNMPSDPAMFGLIGGMSAHALVGPVVHWAHGHVGRGFAVLGLNLTLTAVGFVSGLYLNVEGPPAVVGYLTGPLLDIALFSDEIAKQPLPTTSRNSPPLGVTFGIAPMVDSTRCGLLLTGQF